MTVKFHEKAIILYGVAQTAAELPAIRAATGTGTITTTNGSPNVTGVTTQFTTEAPVGTMLYTTTGVFIGKVKTVSSATAIVLEDNCDVNLGQVLTGANFYIGEGTKVTTGTISTTAASAAVTGSGTHFTTELTVGGYIYTVDDKIIGQVLSIASDTSATLVTAVPASPTARSEGVMAISDAVTAVKFKTGLGPLNALATINLNFSTEITTDSYVYTGDELSRDEATNITDIYAKMDFETLLPALGSIAGGDPVVGEIPYVDWFRAINGAIILSTGSGGYAQVTNSASSNVYLTIQVRRSSPDLAMVFEQKCFTITDARGTIDLEGTIGKQVTLKFAYMGNLKTTTNSTTIVPDFTDQKTVLAPRLASSTITLSSLVPYTTTALPAVASSSNVCFEKISAPNLMGFEFNRYQTSCEDGWSKGATPSDVTLNIIEDEATALFNPMNHLSENHRLTLRWGSISGYKIELDFRKVQLAKVNNSKVANYAGQELQFRNIDYLYIKLY